MPRTVKYAPRQSSTPPRYRYYQSQVTRQRQARFTGAPRTNPPRRDEDSYNFYTYGVEPGTRIPTVMNPESTIGSDRVTGIPKQTTGAYKNNVAYPAASPGYGGTGMGSLTVTARDRARAMIANGYRPTYPGPNTGWTWQGKPMWGGKGLDSWGWGSAVLRASPQPQPTPGPGEWVDWGGWGGGGGGGGRGYTQPQQYVSTQSYETSNPRQRQRASMIPDWYGQLLSWNVQR